MEDGEVDSDREMELDYDDDLPLHHQDDIQLLQPQSEDPPPESEDTGSGVVRVVAADSVGVALSLVEPLSQPSGQSVEVEQEIVSLSSPVLSPPPPPPPSASSNLGVVEAEPDESPSRKRPNSPDASAGGPPEVVEPEPKRRKYETSSDEEEDLTPERVPPPAAMDVAPPVLPPRGPLGLSGCRKVEDFDHLGKIDSGTYGVVYRARDKITGEIVALKKIKMENETEGFPITSLREIHILLKMKHRNIVDVKEIVVGKKTDQIYMVMEFMEHDLKKVMELMKAPNRFSPSEVKCIMQQLLSATNYMHTNWVIHRDLKCSNLLFNNKGQLKVCDFGLARHYGDPLRPMTPVVVTLWYRAPELLLGAPMYTCAVDMWSVGCIFAELLLKKALFEGHSEPEQLQKIFEVVGTPTAESWPEFPNLPGSQKITFKRYPNILRRKFPAHELLASNATSMTENGFDLLQRMLMCNPARRITAEEALNHPYFTEAPLPKREDQMPTFPSAHEDPQILRDARNEPSRRTEREIRRALEIDVRGKK
eukprot:gnl/Spiro4/6686_TR3447_c0_g1_i1.p1 gnl/Spiro4/6686_TR3447_c0_g1~~gnl/Spiro4/6686_TR3447_c0_g1_i1.p1  ORF type:complete len:544 (-),score=104.29 gnl/Spiro4/6686_TR3447_c0_g1_i1:55-1662(-)